MRRALASFLAAVFSFPLIAAAVHAHAASDLPACCRRNGKHHCAMADMARQGELPAGPAVTASQPKCPLFPQAQIVPAGSKTILPGAAPRVGAPHLFRLTVASADHRCPRLASRGSVQKRGPPSLV